MGTPLALEGKKFGRLKVVRKAGRQGVGIMWKCTCKCGNTVAVRASALTTGAVVSCGCHKSESMRKRNLAGTAGRPRRIVTVDGKNMTMARAAEKCGLSQTTLTSRIDRGVKDPFSPGHKSPTMVVLNGQRMSIAGASRKLKVPYGTLHGWFRMQKIFSRLGKINLEVAT